MTKLLQFLRKFLIVIFYIAFFLYGLFAIGASFVGFQETFGTVIATIATILTAVGFVFLIPIGDFIWAYNVMDWGILFSLLFALPGIAFTLLGLVFALGGEFKKKILKTFGR